MNCLVLSQNGVSQMSKYNCDDFQKLLGSTPNTFEIIVNNQTFLAQCHSRSMFREPPNSIINKLNGTVYIRKKDYSKITNSNAILNKLEYLFKNKNTQRWNTC